MPPCVLTSRWGSYAHRGIGVRLARLAVAATILSWYLSAAAEWQPIGSTSMALPTEVRGLDAAMELSAAHYHGPPIRVTRSQQRRGWLLSNLPDSSMSVAAFVEVDCKRNESRILESGWFSDLWARGSITNYTISPQSIPSVILEGTPVHVTMEAFCGSKQSRRPQPSVWAPLVVDMTNQFIDPATLEVRRARYYSIWVLTNYQTATHDGSLSAQLLTEVDCTERRVRSLEAWFFSKQYGAGDVITPEIPIAEGVWTALPPGRQQLIDRVCALPS